MSGGGDLRNERTLDTRINRVCGDLAELADQVGDLAAEFDRMTARVQRLEEQHVGVASLDVPCAECDHLRDLLAAAREEVRWQDDKRAAAEAECAALRERVRVYERLLTAAARERAEAVSP